jgi:hypothetical protein
LSRSLAILALGVLVACWCLSAAPALADVPLTMAHGGRLSLEGTPLEGEVSLIFSLLDATDEQHPLWSELHQGVICTDGFFEVVLGEGNPLPVDKLAAAADRLELEVTITDLASGDIQLEPRLKVSSVPFAVAAGTVACMHCVGAVALKDRYALGDNNGAAVALAQGIVTADSVAMHAIGTVALQPCGKNEVQYTSDDGNSVKCTNLLSISSKTQTVTATSDLQVSGDLYVDGAVLDRGGREIREADGGWMKTYDKTGWMNADYKGGWYMTDTQWVRSLYDKSVITGGTIEADAGFLVKGGYQVIDGGGAVHATSINVSDGVKTPGTVRADGGFDVGGITIVDSSRNVIATDVRGYVGAGDTLGSYLVTRTWNGTPSQFAMFTHSNRTSVTDYAIVADRDGDTWLNAKSGKKVSLRVNNVEIAAVSDVGFSAPTFIGALSGNASTAGALFTTPTQCTNQFARGVAANGDAQCGSIANADISSSAAIANSKIAGLGALATLSAIGSAEITNGSIVDADISSIAAIANSKIAGLGALATLSAVGSAEITNGSIVDADVSSTAAISGSKIAPDFGTQTITGGDVTVSGTVTGGTINATSWYTFKGHYGFLVFGGGVCLNAKSGAWDAHEDSWGTGIHCDYTTGVWKLVCPAGTYRVPTWAWSVSGLGGEGGLCVLL